MDKLPEIFKVQLKKGVDNNDKVYYSSLANINNKNKTYFNNNDSINTKLRKLFNNGSYIFNIKVIIKTKNNSYDTKIAGKLGDRIITIDNKIIPINEIIDIIEK